MTLSEPCYWKIYILRLCYTCSCTNKSFLSNKDPTKFLNISIVIPSVVLLEQVVSVMWLFLTVPWVGLQCGFGMSRAYSLTLLQEMT